MKREEQKKKVLNIRNDFPIFKNSDLIYLDSAATSQKPECVLRAQQDFYEKYNESIKISFPSTVNIGGLASSISYV